jgi:Pyruvate/2-oxoacid:ferredoxin oxidoreductase delta subunit
MQLRELIADAANNRPTVDGERCVHSQAEVATCCLCVSCCPTDAWQLHDDALYIDSSLCDGCGLCAAQCPEGALVQPGVALAEHGGEFASAACARAEPGQDRHVIPCINAIGLSQLTAAWQQGLRQLHLSVGDCTHCNRQDDDALLHRVRALNHVLRARRLPALSVHLHANGGGSCDAPCDRPAPSQAAVSRRDFFGRMFRTLAETVAEQTPGDWHAPGECLPPARQGDAVLFTPHIDASRCNGCDACARICPHAALSVDDDGYRFDANACSGCRLCSDVCDQGAVSVQVGATAMQLHVTLHSYRCTACAATFHTPSIQTGDRPLCRICHQANHARALFQVLDGD